jgi:hypothetical protein
VNLDENLYHKSGLLKRWLQRKGNQTVVMKKPEKMDKKMGKKIERR